ncbi:MAG: ATP-binding protein [Dehalococcoidia bacterium]
MDAQPRRLRESAPRLIQNGLDQEMHRSLAPVLIATSCLYWFLAMGHFVILPDSIRVPLAIAEAVTAMILSATYLSLRRGNVPVSRTSAVVSAVIALALFNSLLHMTLAGELRQTTSVLVVLVGVGFLVLKTRWYVAAMTATLTGWAITISIIPSTQDDVIHFGFFVLMAAVISAVINFTRVRSVARQEILRWAADVRTEEALQVNRRLRLILDSAAEGIYGLDGSGNATFVNPAAAGMLGWNPYDLLGQDPHSRIHHSRPNGDPYPVSDCPTHAILEGGDVQRVTDDVFWRRDGTSFPVEYISAPLQDDTGTLEGVVVIFQDISERLALDRMKNEFVSLVGHELRTPLTSIIAFSDILHRNQWHNLNEQQTDQIEVIRRNGRRLQMMIDDLLTVSQMQSGHLRLNFANFEACRMLEELVDDFEPVMKGRNQRIKFVRPDEPVMIHSDRTRLAQVVSNLLTNAQKYSPEGSEVTLQISSDRDTCKIEVSDLGAGIPDEVIDQVFEPFFRADNELTRSVSGTGVGLYISRILMERLGGKILLESRAECGTNASVSLPLNSLTTLG